MNAIVSWSVGSMGIIGERLVKVASALQLFSWVKLQSTTKTIGIYIFLKRLFEFLELQLKTNQITVHSFYDQGKTSELGLVIFCNFIGALKC